MLLSPLASARQDPSRSVFRPPTTILRSVPPRPKASGSLTAAATPWTPGAKVSMGASAGSGSNHQAAGGAPKPPAPLHSSPPLQAKSPPPPGAAVPPPTALGNSPSLQPSAVRSRELPPPVSIEAVSSAPAMSRTSSSLESPLTATTPLSSSKLIITEEAVESGVYTFEMLQSLRHDCAHTPQRVLNWVVQMYQTHPSLKVPPHLVLTVDEPIVDDEAAGLLCRPTVVRRRPIRQVHHKVMSVLSRVTPQKYVELQRELLELPLKQTTDEELKEVVRVFFEKAVQEQKFSPLYANLVTDVCKITDAERELEKEQKDKLLGSRMRRELLTTCQDEFRRPLQLSEDDKVDPVTGKPLDAEEVESKRDRLKRRLCGNIKFVGELYKKKLVTERVVGQIMEVLVGDYDAARPTSKEEYVFEVFQTMLKCVGVVCKDSNPDMLNKNMMVVRKISTSHPTARVRFLMMDLEDLARRGWVVKDRLMTMEERERESVEVHRRGYEEIERRARARQQELDEYVIASSSNIAAGHSHNLSTPTNPPNHQMPMRPTNFVTRPPALNQSHLLRTQSNGIEIKHPHGTPTASPAKPGKLFGSQAPTTPSSVMMTPPPKYQRNPSITADRSPIVHPSANLQVPHVLSNGVLNESVHSSNNGAGMMGRISSTNSLNSNGGPYAATPLSPNAPPLPLGELTTALMTQFTVHKNVEEVLSALRNLSIPHRISVLTLWLRRACTNTKLFTEREQVCILFAGIMQCSTSLEKSLLSPHDLAVCFMEWIRYDIERGQFENCPRLFANIGALVLQAYQRNPAFAADGQPMAWTRAILNGMIFSVLLRELHAHESLQVIPTLVKDAQPVVQQILSSLPDHPVTNPIADLMLAMQNRFRILPFVLYGEGALTRAKTPPTPTLRGSPLNDSLSSYDAFSQCLMFPKIAEDIEFALYRRLRESTDANGWREQAVQMATGSAHSCGNNPAARLTQLMKVVGTLLTILHPKDGTQPLTTNIRSDDLDHVVHSSINKRKNALEYQCAVVVELMAHFTYTVANITTPAVADSPSKTTLSMQQMNGSLSDANSSWTNIETRMSKMTSIFKRWAASHIIQRDAVLEALRGIKESSVGPHGSNEDIVAAANHSPLEALCTLQYNFVVESSWSSAIQMLGA